MKRRNWTPLQRLGIFMSHGGICSICKAKIDAVREKYDLEHQIPIAMGGADDESNITVVHSVCHKSKTKDDVTNIAKAKRRQAKHLGAAKPKKPWPKRGEWHDNTKYINQEDYT